jgi:hypothetical protein
MIIETEDFLQDDDAAARRGVITGNGRIKSMAVLGGQFPHLRHFDTSVGFFFLITH